VKSAATEDLASVATALAGRRMPEANAPPAAAQSIPVPVQAMHLRKPRRSQAIVVVIVKDEFFFGFHIFACFLC